MHHFKCGVYTSVKPRLLPGFQRLSWQGGSVGERRGHSPEADRLGAQPHHMLTKQPWQVTYPKSQSPRCQVGILIPRGQNGSEERLGKPAKSRHGEETVSHEAATRRLRPRPQSGGQSRLQSWGCRNEGQAQCYPERNHTGKKALLTLSTPLDSSTSPKLKSRMGMAAHRLIRGLSQ